MDSDLAPSFLVAAPGLSCPFFHHSVVLLVEHDENGSLGFVINRPGDADVSSLAEQLEMETDGQPLPGAVWVGGPVAPETGWVIFDPESGDAEVDHLRVGDRVALSSSRELLEHLVQRRGPEKYAVLLGYAGWGPGQLDDEIRDGAWISVDVDARLLFDLAPEERWMAALSSLGIDPGRMASGAGVAEA